MKISHLLIGALCLFFTIPPRAFAQIPVQCIDNVVVSLTSGATEITTCEGDGLAESYRFRVSSFAMPTGYLVTDENNVILLVSLGSNINFEGLGAGNLRVWAFTFLGQLTAEVGQDADETQLGSICSALSVNFIPVNNFVPDAGLVSTIDGNTSQFVCPGDGNADVVAFSNTTGSDENYAYVITDENNIILAFANGASFDFDGAPEGICRVWGLSYAGNITAQVGDNAATATLSDACFDLSDNYIEIIRTQPDGGTVALSNGNTSITVCVSDGLSDLLTFTAQSGSPAPYVFVITDENNIILAIADGNMADFEDAATGICRVWGLSYTGTITAQVGDDAAAVALSDDCFDLSDNFIEVLRQQADGGQVSLSDGSEGVVVCVGDGEADLLSFVNTSTGTESYTYLITDENNIVLAFAPDGSFDFDGAGTGVCRVWGLAYAGNLLVQVGDDAAATALSDGCFELSANFITVRREAVDGGTVAMPNGNTIRYTCPGDGNPDIVRFDSTGSSSSQYVYVITDENGNILALPDGDSFDFDDAPAGTCLVWGLAYSGNITAQLGDNAAAIALSDECYDLSDNFITVVREVPEGGAVAMPDGGTLIYTCPGDGNEDIVSFDSTGTSSGPYSYVITDENNMILAFPTGDSFDFDSAPAGVCRVWGLAYTGTVTAQVGDNAAAVDLSDDCFDLSDNFITVIRETPVGGDVEMPGGGREIFVCPGDGNPDVVQFDSTETSSNPYVYLVTDESNFIFQILTEDSFDFESLPEGIYRVWGMAYTGNIISGIGSNAGDDPQTDDCWDLSDSFILVHVAHPEGGTVATESGETEVLTCPGDGNADIIKMDSTGTSGQYAYVITDENNIILDLPSGDSFDFDNAPEGVCRIWGLAYTGTILAQVGDDAAAVLLTDGCFDLSDNFVTVVRESPSGGTVSTEDGATLVYTCPGDGVADLIQFDSAGASNINFIYVVTDENNVILAFPDGDSVDFEEAPEGICRVWGLAYTGNITAQVGDNAAEVSLSDDCFDLSDNFVTVVRELPEGGMVAMPNGNTIRYTCPGDGVADVVSFDSTGTSGGAYAYVITDENNVILAFPTGDSFDFDDAPAGICRVWGLAYTGAVTAQVGDNAAEVDLAEGCFDLSDNFITVVREVPEGGNVAMPNGSTIRYTCPGDGVADLVSFDSTGTSSGPYAYVITDENNVILAFPDGDSFDFDDAPAGICRVWGLAYTGAVTAQVGDNAADVALSSDCWDLSDNFITVVRETPEGGSVAMPNGNTIRYTCPGDGMADIVSFDSLGASSGPYVYVVTDENNLILAIADGDSFDFDGAPEGTCRVWGLAYTGMITAQIGDNAAEVALSNDCWDLSDNFITVIRQVPVGGTVSYADGGAVQYTCPGDGNADVLHFDSTGAVGAGFLYVITDEQNIILATTAADSFDFDESPEGICRIWGLAYTGSVIAEVGDTASVATLTDDCWALSDNYIVVIRQTPIAGTVVLEGGSTEIYTCPGDGNADLLAFDSLNTSLNFYTYVITDENNVILALPDGDSFDFEDAPEGTCRVWGLSYTGTITAQVGDTASVVALTDDCFDLSDNFITVVRVVPEGGTVATNGSTIRYICPGDGNADIIPFDSTGTAGQAYAYVITDENNNILAFPDGDSFDFDEAPAGVCRIWGLAYNGNVTAQVGDNAAEVALSDDCFDLSDNFITVIRETPEGGMVATEDGLLEVTTCPGDGNADIVTMDSTGTAGLYVYVITDENNNILVFAGGDMIDFELAGIGVARVWGLAYTGNILAEIGDNAATVQLTDDCFDLSDNFVTVIRTAPMGGSVSTETGETLVYTCPGDGVADVVSFDSTGAVGANFAYIVTDENNIILGLPAGDEVDFEEAGTGTCRVWGLAYNGNFTAEVGDDATGGGLSDDCYALSENFITVVRELPQGGTVATADGAPVVTICPGDGSEDVVSFVSMDNLGANYVFVITDENNVILNVIDGNSFDFEASTPSVCRVWGLAYNGNLTAQIGDNAAEVALSDACFDLSDNFVIVVKTQPDGGSITTADGSISVDICVGDGSSDLVEILVDGASSDNYGFLITDDNDIFLAFLNEPFFDFGNATGGTYRIYGISYIGLIDLFPGDNIFGVTISDECHDLSNNFIEINATGVDGGVIFSNLGQGPTYLCPGDGQSDELEFITTTSTPEADYIFVVTNENDVVLGFIPDNNLFDFELAGTGISKIWGISYTGNLTFTIGNIITNTPLSDGCYALSDNSITIVRDQPEGGMIASSEGEDDILVCPGPDGGVIEFTTTSTSLTAYIYLITDTDNVVLDVSEDGLYDFANLPIGQYRVWGLSYTDELVDLIGVNAAETALSNTCFELSANFISVTRGPSVDGGVVASLLDGRDTIYTCMDGLSDLVVMNTTSTDTTYQYIITGAGNNVIVADVEGDLIDFEGAADGEYHIWGISFYGDLLLNFGNNILTTPVSDSCFAISANFVTVFRDNPEGATVSTSEGQDTIMVVVGDGVEDEISFVNTSTSLTQYAYVVTDENNSILEIVDGDTQNFEGATPGTCRVWGLAYTGNLLAQVGDVATDVALSDGCFDLSDNFVLVIRVDALPVPGEQDAVAANALIQRLDVHPNPAREILTVRFELGEAAESLSTLQVMDATGRLMQLERVASVAGENNYTLSVSDWASGLYVVFLNNGQEVQALKFLVNRD
ncbi:MAG TPA: T9SS type A sorting domain-containing protein [Saprospiraceae bacterium]|nr:T9SS type A sorting domain-containing protein [Saprospiraceae bacterium]HMQ84179.1 T9SS type A sorting domain-containing protein [Saprospiraceae bacterium]